jgi:hypothetical protein
LKEEVAKKEAAKKAAAKKAAKQKAAAEKAAREEAAAATAAEKAAAAMAAAEKVAREKAAAKKTATEKVRNKSTVTKKAPETKTPANKNAHKKASSKPQHSPRIEPTAGPSNHENEAIRVQHRAPTFGDLDEDSEEDAPSSKKRRYESESSDESDNSRTGAGKNRRKPNRRVAYPIGELFDPPCMQCVKRRLDCEKDKYAAACIRCYIGKNRCDYGGRYFQAPNLYKKGRGRGRGNVKGKRNVKIEKEDVESEDETDNRRRPAKRIRSSQYVDDDDEMMVSGYETSQHPPLSRSPSPKPRREAAKRAAVALAATVRFVNYEENRLKKHEEKYRKSSYSFHIRKNSNNQFPLDTRPADTTDNDTYEEESEEHKTDKRPTASDNDRKRRKLS